MERKGKYYFSAILLTFWSSIYTYNWNQSISGSSGYIEGLSKNDYLRSLFAGPEVLNRDAIQFIRIPGAWLLFYFVLFYMNEKYFLKLFTGIETQVMIREKSLERWWNKRCIQALKQLLLYYTAAWISIWGIGEITGSEGDVFCSVLTEMILPATVSFFLCMVQGIFALWKKAGISLLVVMGYLIISVYWERWYLLGNYLMIGRSREVGGLAANCGLVFVLTVILSFAVWHIGRIYLRKIDLQ